MKTCFVKAPGTCGEYIQGLIHNEPCLVSSPVDLYASAAARKDGFGRRDCLEKAQQALNYFAKRHQVEEEMNEISVCVRSKIPMLKGMASSTSDMCAAVCSCADLLGIHLSPEELSEICLSVEPSDNLMFEELILSSHYTGEIFEYWHETITCDVLALNFDREVSTCGIGPDEERQKNEEAFSRCITLLHEGAKENDLGKIGEAVTLSARLNQPLVEYKDLENMIALAEEFKAHGVMIGHSGSIVGLIIDTDFDEESFLKALQNSPLNKDFLGARRLHLISGGILHDEQDTEEELEELLYGYNPVLQEENIWKK